MPRCLRPATSALLRALLVLACGLGTATAGVSAHPLDPLTADEIDDAVAILRAAGRTNEATRFPEVSLIEPAKGSVLAWHPGDAIARRARVVWLDRPANRRFDAIVDLGRKAIESSREIEEGQPMILLEEYDLAGEAVRKDERWRSAMAARGIVDPASVYLDVWAPGEGAVKDEGERKNKDKKALTRTPRLARVLSFHRKSQKNPYGPPIEGVVALVDLNTWQVLEVLDHGQATLAGDDTDFYHATVVGPEPAVRPLTTALAVEVDGQRVAWRHFRLRWSLTPREGLVLHQVGWADRSEAASPASGSGVESGSTSETVRPILYRASLSEMLVPYGDPSEGWAWRSAFDEGEYGLGRLSNPLVPGTTAPEGATLLDAVFASDAGKAEPLPRAVAVYERDGGVAWNHYDMVHGTAARRARELVLEWIATIGNYDYTTRWILREDASIALEISLSGSLLTKGVESTRCEVCSTAEARASSRSGRVEPSGAQRHGTLVSPHVLAPNHQHFVSVRLDLDVDGTRNGVKEMDVRAESSRRQNPHGNAFLAVPTYLKSERRAARDLSAATHRTWEVFSTRVSSALGHPTAYALLAGANGAPFLSKRSALRKRAGFIDHAIHVTRFHEDELHAAGDYPSQNQVTEGLSRWMADDEPLEDSDVVLWYTLGVTHVPRPEEYPIMGSTTVGLRLEPVGFFARNPALDSAR